MPIIGYEDERMVQKTIGVVNFNGVQYEIDWRYYEEDGEIIAAEPAAWVFLTENKLLILLTIVGRPRVGTPRKKCCTTQIVSSKTATCIPG